MLGRYLDALDAEARDRVIEAQVWGTGSISQPCLVRHSEGGYGGVERCFRITDRARRFEWRAGELRSDFQFRDLDNVGYRFDRLCRRFGMDRVVRACKLRAAKSNRISIPASSTEEAIRGA